MRKTVEILRRNPLLCVVLCIIFFILAGCALFKILRIVQEIHPSPIPTRISTSVQQWEDALLFMEHCASSLPITIEKEGVMLKMHCDLMQEVKETMSVYTIMRLIFWAFLFCVFVVILFPPTLSLLSRRFNSFKREML